ncbi:S8 family peptidase [Paenibacillus qinlingensis]|uniref:S8 family peptidase n=1 Tax=Paenibacillus qinlingensis TaxID=1837343 RepID=UPI001565EBAC|nr:S8 family serine peptidase [Paenibacillus qinlingensis]NQX62748.1 S8 family serine peptidase [Paenibacillus qinlingensis]
MYKRKLLLALVSLFTVFNLSLGTLGFAQEPNDQASTSTVPSFNESDIVPGKVLVKYKQQPAANGIQSLSARSASSWTTVNFGNELSVSDKLAELQKDPNVEYAEPVYKVHLIATEVATDIVPTVSQSVYTGTSAYKKTWGKRAAHVDQMGTYSDLTKNQNVTVAVMDTGIDMTHPALQNSIIQGYDFVNKDNNAQDDNGHGTHVSGIIAAQPYGGADVGVAHGVQIMPLKVLDSTGGGDTSYLYQAFQHVLAHPVDVINMSLGSYADSIALHDIIKKVHDQGTVIVSASGNDSNNWTKDEIGQYTTQPWDTTDTHRTAYFTSYPAAYEEVISVGAIAQLTDLSYAIADFSNIGKIDLVAPGINIYSTIIGNSYDYKSGTSMATPFVAGLAALLKAANPDLDAEDIRLILQTSAQPENLLSLQPNIYEPSNHYPFNYVSQKMAYGDGLINGIRAFEVPRLQLSPAVAFNFPTNPTLSYNFKLVDIHDDIVNVTYSVYLNSKAYNETSIIRELDGPYAFVATPSWAPLLNGQKQLAATMSNVDPVHNFYMFGTWEEPLPTGGVAYHRSNLISFYSPPNTPLVSLQPGAYRGTQTVTLTSPYTTGTIYYKIEQKNKAAIISTFPISGGELKFSEDTSLTVATYHNNVFSDNTYYLYTITPNAGGGGGGGGGGSSQQPPFLNADGKMTYEFKPAHVDLLIQLNKALSDLTLDATTKEKVDILSVEIDADIVQKASQMNRPIVIASNDINMQIPPNAWPIKLSTSKILFTSSKSTTAIPNFTSASAIYDFSVTEDGSKISTFASPVKVTIPFDTKKVKDVHKLSVYVYDEAQGAWTPIGGSLNADGTMTASLAHFSKYAVLEKQNETILKDIKDHWAQKEIENLAGKGIIDGIDQDSFQPDTTLTRAQFVTIIAKALKLQQSDHAAIFQDISADAWYRNSVYAAYSAGIISGMSEQTFVPDAPITREQMALTMVNAYLHAAGKKLADIVTTQEVKYADEGTISTWARSYVRIASALGLLSGTTGGQFAPADNASRAQAAVVIYRLLDKVQ